MSQHIQFASRNKETDHLEHVLFAGLPDEFVLVLHQLGPYVLRPAALGVVHACLNDLLGVCVHVGVRLRDVTSLALKKSNN